MITPPYEQSFYIEDVCRFRSFTGSSESEQKWVNCYDRNNNNNENEITVSIIQVQVQVQVQDINPN